MTAEVHCQNQDCPYYTRIPEGEVKPRVVFPEIGVGSENNLVIIGEAPGATEEAEGKPFVGKSGKLLRRELQSVGLELDKVTFINICWCRPPGNITPPKDVQQACTDHFKEYWDEILGATDTHLTVGKTATDFFLKRGKRGRVYKKEDSSVWLPAYHPAYVLRKPYALWDFKDDLMLTKTVYERDRGEAPPGFYTATCVDELNEMFHDLNTAERFAFDLETIGLNPFGEGAKILTISFAIEGKTWVLPFQIDNTAFAYTFLVDFLQKVFNSNALKIAQNAKFDIRWLQSIGVEVKNFYFDTMIAQYLLNSKEFEPIGLKHLTWEYFPEYGGYDEGIDLSPDKILDNDRRELLKYSAMDSFLCLKIAIVQEEALKAQGLWRVFNTILMPAVVSLSDIEHSGFRLDKKWVEAEIKEYAKREKALDRKIRADKSIPLTAEERETFNFNSNKQLGGLLFDKMNLPIIGLTDTGAPKVDAKTLKALAGFGTKFCRDLGDMKRYKKWKSTYLENYLESALETPELVVRTDYNLGTRGGRLSSGNPPLQNAPSLMKRCFISRFRGGYLLEADYKQVELRVCAVYSKDAAMIEMLNSGRDIHSESIAKVKSLMTGEVWRPEDITEDERKRGKGFNFGLIYGRGAGGLSAEFGIPTEEAETLKTGFFALFPDILTFHEKCIKKFKETGYAYSMLGRRRFLGGYPDDKAFRRAINFPIQSLASDICVHTLNKLWVALKERGMRSKIVATVHDSIVVDCSPEELEDVAVLVDELAVEPDLFDEPPPVTFEVGISIGKTWSELDEV